MSERGRREEGARCDGGLHAHLSGRTWSLSSHTLCSHRRDPQEDFILTRPDSISRLTCCDVPRSLTKRGLVLADFVLLCFSAGERLWISRCGQLSWGEDSLHDAPNRPGGAGARQAGSRSVSPLWKMSLQRLYIGGRELWESMPERSEWQDGMRDQIKAWTEQNRVLLTELS